MLKNHITKIIIDSLIYKPTNSQSKLIDKLSDFFLSIQSPEIFLIKGYAGTGKTAILSALANSFISLKIKSVILAPTGRAAKVVSNRSGKIAYTIHKKIYRQKSAKDGFGEFNLDTNLHKNTIFIVDEASMIGNENNDKSLFGSGRLLDDLIQYVFQGTNCKLILMGDTAQLPPVFVNLSPALDTEKMKHYGYIVYEHTLTEVLRQAEESGVLYNANILRKKVDNPVLEKFIETQRFPDIVPVFGSEILESIDWAYDKYGIEECIVICRSNKRANKFNHGIRTSILYREERLTVGDLLMIVKNNYYWLDEIPEIEFLANGEIAEIISIHGYETLYDKQFADVSIRLLEHDAIEIEVKILMNTLDSDTASLNYDEQKEFYAKVAEDYNEIRNKRELYQKIREDKYFNALQVKYAYAITCHKAQGGQWKAAFIDLGYFTDDSINAEFFRWLYTAFTRAIEKLYLINFPEKLMKDITKF